MLDARSWQDLVVDFHTHFVPSGFVRYLAEHGAGSGFRVAEDGSGQSLLHLPAESAYLVSGPMVITAAHHDLETRRAAMMHRGIDVQVLSAPTYLYRYDLPTGEAASYSRAFNDALAVDVSRGAGSFIGLGLLPLQDPEAAVREVERLSQVPGMLGVAVGTRVGECDLDHPAQRPVREALERHRMPVLVHPNHTDGVHRMQDHMLTHLVGLPGETALIAARLILEGRLDETPALRLCLAHAGGSFALLLGRIDAAFHRMDLRARCARPPADYVTQMMVDSVAHGVPAARLVLEVFGSSAVLLGSDFPAKTGLEDPLAALRAIGLGPEDEHMIRGGNAERLRLARMEGLHA